MSLGSLVLKFHQKFEHGLSTSYYRDVVKTRILNTKPITHTTDHTCEIHVLTCTKDWLNLIWALKTFYHYSNRHYALCIHDDGTLTESNRTCLQKHFPHARLIDRPRADAQLFSQLQFYPHCLEFRKNNHLAPKIFDFASYLESNKMLLIDSDILFFAKPTILLQRIEDPNYRFNIVNADVKSAYTVDPADVQEKCGFEMINRFNSGLGLIHRASLNFEWIEEFLTLPNIVGHFWRIEQTLYALCSSKFGTELLPPAYDVHLDGGINGAPSRHYVGAIRHLMYSEGMQRLVKEGFLRELN